MKIIIFSETNSHTIQSNIGKPEYSYYYVLKSFLPLLERLGDVVVVTNLEREVDKIYVECRLRKEVCFFLSFAPPHRTLTTLECPTIAVFAWEFDDIPDEQWGVEPSSDWRLVLRRLAGVIVHSSHTADVIRKAMGADYPVVVVPAPVWQRDIAQCRTFAPKEGAELRFPGWLFDSDQHSLSDFEEDLVWERQFDGVSINRLKSCSRVIDPEPKTVGVVSGKPLTILWRHLCNYATEIRELTGPVTRVKSRARNLIREGQRSQYFSDPVCESFCRDQHVLRLSGTVYTTVLNPADGRKNLHWIVHEFCDAFRDQPQATLVIKSSYFKADYAIAKVVAELIRQPGFVCRIIVISGYLDNACYTALLHATTYAVNASCGEGQCLPLMEYMTVGIPAVAPDHTALADYINDANAFVVEHSLEPASWPHDPRAVFRTFKHQIKRASLRSCYRASFELAHDDRRYSAMSEAAMRAVESYCSIDLLELRLKEFLALGTLRHRLQTECQRERHCGVLTHNTPDCQTVASADAAMSGWLRVDTSEVVTGVAVGTHDTVFDLGGRLSGVPEFCVAAGATVIVSDSSQKNLRARVGSLRMTGAKNLQVMACDWAQLPISSGVVTKVIAGDLLQSVAHPQCVLQELARIGAPDAQYVLTVPASAVEQIALRAAPDGYFGSTHHARIFSREDFISAVESVGLVVETYRTEGFYWALWLSMYWLSQRANGESHISKSLNPAPPYPEALSAWAVSWGALLRTPGGEILKNALDDILPQRQLIVARKL